MSRKPKKGYFVRGQFVAEGSELDLALKREARGEQEHSKTERKRESSDLQALGEELLQLQAARLTALSLPERLLDALSELKRIRDFEGRRRQLQFVGKLMRTLDPAMHEAMREQLAAQRAPSAAETLALHQAEDCRARLIDDDASLTAFVSEHPAADAQALRALIRQARKDALAAPAELPGQAPRHGRAYRELFQSIRALLGAPAP
jgi:ribosome-associated protein